MKYIIKKSLILKASKSDKGRWITTEDGNHAFLGGDEKLKYTADQINEHIDKNSKTVNEKKKIHELTKDEFNKIYDKYENKLKQASTIEELKNIDKEFTEEIGKLPDNENKKDFDWEIEQKIYKKIDNIKSELKTKLQNKISGKTIGLKELKKIVEETHNPNNIFVTISPSKVQIDDDIWVKEFKYWPYNSEMYVLQDSKKKSKENYNGKLPKQMYNMLNDLMSGEKLSYYEPKLTFK